MAIQYTIHISPISVESAGLKPSHRYAVMVDFRGGARHTIGNGVAVAEATAGNTYAARWAPNPDFSTTPNYTPIRITLEDKKIGKEIEIIVLEGGPRGSSGSKPKTAGEFRINVGDFCDIASVASVHRIVAVPCSIEGNRAIVNLQLAVHPTGRQIPTLQDNGPQAVISEAPEGKTIINGTAASFLVAKGLFPASFAGKEIMLDSDVADEILKLLPPSKGGIRPSQGNATAVGANGAEETGPLATVFDINDSSKKAQVGPLITALNRDAKTAELELNRARYDRIYTVGQNNVSPSIAKHRDGSDRTAAIQARIDKLEMEERAVKNRMMELESEQHVRDVTIDACSALERIGVVQEQLQAMRKQLASSSSNGASSGIHDLARDIVAAQREIALLEWQSKSKNILVHLLSGGGDLSPDWALLVSEPQPRLEVPTDLPELISDGTPTTPPPTATHTSSSATSNPRAQPSSKQSSAPPPASAGSDPLDDFFGGPVSPAKKPTTAAPQHQQQAAPARQASTDLFASWEVVDGNTNNSSTKPQAPPPVASTPAPEIPKREPSTLDDARPVRCEFEGSLAKPAKTMDFDGLQTLHIFEGKVTNLESNNRTTSPALVLRFETPQRPGIKAGTSVSSALKSLKWHLEVDDIFSSDKIAVTSAVTHITHGRVQQLALLLREDELNGGAVKALHDLAQSKSGNEEESVLLLQPMEGNRILGTTYNLIVTASLNVGNPATRRVALKF